MIQWGSVYVVGYRTLWMSLAGLGLDLLVLRHVTVHLKSNWSISCQSHKCYAEFFRELIESERFLYVVVDDVVKGFAKFNRNEQ